MTTQSEDKQPDSDEMLRSMYGANAIFTRVQGFTLVHLDQPTEEVIEQRSREFDPAEFFFDDCPLCQMAMKEGNGHVVFDGYSEEDYEESDDFDDEELQLPARELADAVSRLDFEARFFGELLEGVNGELEEAYTRDVLALSARLNDVLWNDESKETVQPFEELIASAVATTQRVGTEIAELEEQSEHVVTALQGLAIAWKRV